jgi:GNAT superfamily N-acetyltransferase
MTTTPTTLRRLTITDIDRIRALHATAGRDLPPGFIRRKTDAQMCGYLDGTNGVAYGILDGGALAAMGLLRIPTGGSRAGGPPFPLVPPDDWPFHACFLEHTMVHPRARGRGYQRALLEARLRYAAGTTMRWTCGGVRLLTVASWRNLLAAGRVIAGIRRDPGYAVIGLLRAVDGRSLTAPAGDETAVAIDDVVGHERALADGRVGVRMATDGTVRYRPYGRAATSAAAVTAP